MLETPRRKRCIERSVLEMVRYDGERCNKNKCHTRQRHEIRQRTTERDNISDKGNVRFNMSIMKKIHFSCGYIGYYNQHDSANFRNRSPPGILPI
jgi:hypothetical protein